MITSHTDRTLVEVAADLKTGRYADSCPVIDGDPRCETFRISGAGKGEEITALTARDGTSDVRSMFSENTGSLNNALSELTTSRRSAKL
jgi:hypothetical protein